MNHESKAHKSITHYDDEDDGDGNGAEDETEDDSSGFGLNQLLNGGNDEEKSRKAILYWAEGDSNH